MRRLALALLCTLPLAACEAEDTLEEDAIESLDDLKLDSMKAPTEMGQLSETSEWSQGELVKTSRFHLWTFSLTQAQDDVQLWTRPAGEGKPTDTVLYVFKKQEGGGWGHYIAKNDDGHWSFADESASYDEDLAPYSYLALPLEKGDYAVLVKGKTRTTRGPYFVTYDCNGGFRCR